MSTYIVYHYRTNPRNNSMFRFETKSEALAEMRLYTSDERGSSSALEIAGRRVAARGWHESRITWMIFTPRNTYTIVSGEGEQGTTETVRMTLRGLKRRLTQERCGGDRWAYACDADGNRIDV